VNQFDAKSGGAVGDADAAGPETYPAFSGSSGRRRVSAMMIDVGKGLDVNGEKIKLARQANEVLLVSKLVGTTQ
jgi:hypothetical protein